MRYFKFPKWSKRFYPGAIWDFYSKNEKVIYLTFDDGPNPESTEWLLEVLKEHDAKATFFCLGENVQKHSQIFEKIKENDHAIGYHTMHHLDGWKTATKTYITDLEKSKKIYAANLFRPPYGRLKPRQFRIIKRMGLEVVFWSIMPYDFDKSLSSNKRLEILRENTKTGSIIVFHDSAKAFNQLKEELPILLKEWTAAGYRFKGIKHS